MSLEPMRGPGTWIKCLRCDWQGPAEELLPFHPSDEHGINAVCPQCGLDDSDMDTDCEAP